MSLPWSQAERRPRGSGERVGHSVANFKLNSLVKGRLDNAIQAIIVSHVVSYLETFFVVGFDSDCLSSDAHASPIV